MKMFRSWWQLIKQHRVTILVIAFILVIAIALISVVVQFYGTGFNGYNQETIAHTISGPSAGTVIRTEVSQPGKTLWDWLQLLIIPIVLAIGGFLFSQIQKGNEQRITDDNQQEAGLQAYIDSLSDLLLKEGLRKSDIDAEVRKIARVRTLTILSRINTVRKKRGSLSRVV